MRPLISLVIPVYNVEKYFDRCMKSVLMQTYDNFEVILVDDGSTDKSSEMCDEYAANDDRVRVFHKPNGGLSDARNYGVKQAHGELISFVDSDDFITADYLEYLYYLMTRFSADISCARGSMIEKNQTPRLVEYQSRERCLTASEALIDNCYHSVSACFRLYRKDILQRHPYPVGRLYEDLATTYKVVAECNRVAKSERVIYYWVQREGSIRHSEFDRKQLDVLWAAAEQLAYVEEFFPEVEQAARVRCAMAADALADRLLAAGGEECRRGMKCLRNYLRPHFQSVLRDNVRGLGFKLRNIVIMLGYYPVRILWPIGKNLKFVLNVIGSIRMKWFKQKFTGG